MDAFRTVSFENPTPFKPLDDCQAEAHQLLMALSARLSSAKPFVPQNTSLLGRFKKKFATPEEGIPGLYLWGGVGRGKTYLMDAFFETAPVELKRRVHFHHFMHEIHDTLASLPPQPDPLELLADQIAADVRLLCLDEFVVTDITDAMILHGLLRALFQRGITLVTTSNTPPDNLYANGLQRDRFLPAIDLLKKYTQVFNLDSGTDYRLRSLKQANVYFSPLDEQAETGLRKHFTNLCGGHVERAKSLFINHREIPVIKMGADVVWMDFETLCEGPRATSDYIEIAREFHTILLSGLPKLTPKLDAAARRFLHLVDEVYDRNVKLIVSAAVAIDDLYDGKELAFEYARLRSRLTEMQSVDYLARPHLPL